MDAHVFKYLDNIELIRSIATENLADAQQTASYYYDKKAKYPSYIVGDLVMVYDATTAVGTSSKLKKRWTGPHKIEKCNSPGSSYIIRNMTTDRLFKSQIHSNRLKPYHQRKISSNAAAPTVTPQSVSNPSPKPPAPVSAAPGPTPTVATSPSVTNATANRTQPAANPTPPVEPESDDETDSEEWYEIDKITKRKRSGTKTLFYCHFKDGSKSWIDKSDLTDAAIQAFEQRPKRKMKRHKTKHWTR